MAYLSAFCAEVTILHTLFDRCKWRAQVIGVVRQKVLFKNRPRALISKPDPNKR